MDIQNSVKKLGPVSKASEKTDEGRRAALKKLGIYGAYGAYTAPALMVMLKSGKAVAASGDDRRILGVPT